MSLWDEVDEFLAEYREFNIDFKLKTENPKYTWWSATFCPRRGHVEANHDGWWTRYATTRGQAVRLAMKDTKGELDGALGKGET